MESGQGGKEMKFMRYTVQRAMSAGKILILGRNIRKDSHRRWHLTQVLSKW